MASISIEYHKKDIQHEPFTLLILAIYAMKFKFCNDQKVSIQDSPRNGGYDF